MRWVRLLAEPWELRVAPRLVLAVASLVVPGIGPLLAFGMVGAALLGTVGAAAGSAVGDQAEEELGEGIPHEDIYVYEDALRHGHTVLIAYADEDEQAEKASDVMREAGAEDIDELRENWWEKQREGERGALHRQLRRGRGKLSSWLHGGATSATQRSRVFGRRGRVKNAIC